MTTLTLQIKQTLLYLRDDLKIFQRIAALSTRTKTLVSNLFIYKKKDALRHTLKEYEAIRQLMLVFFDSTKEMPYIGGDATKMGANVVGIKNQSRREVGAEEAA